MLQHRKGCELRHQALPRSGLQDSLVGGSGQRGRGTLGPVASPLDFGDRKSDYLGEGTASQPVRG